MRDEGQGDPRQCFDVTPNGRRVAHELGHNFNLNHGGKQSAGVDANCKPNCPSLMSYAGLWDSDTIGFSPNEFESVPLYPSQMDELTGLNTTDPKILDWLSNPSGSFRYQVDAGAIDWDRDGQFSSGTVRAAATWVSVFNLMGPLQRGFFQPHGATPFSG